MGCPYRRKGDLATGKGILVDTYQVFDWLKLTGLAVSLAGYSTNPAGRPYAVLMPNVPNDWK